MRRMLPLLLLVLVHCGPPPSPAAPTPSPPPETPTPPPVEEVDEPLREGPETADLDEQARVLLEAIRDRTRRDALETAWTARQRALEKVRPLEARKGSLTPEQRSQRNQLIRELAIATQQTRDEVNALANRYRVDFVDVNRIDLTKAGLRTLRSIREELNTACSSGRQVVVTGYGCHLGGQEITQEISESRATAVANWLFTYTSCRKSQVTAHGKGIDPTVRHLLGREDPEALALAALVRNAFVYVEKGVSGVRLLD